MLLQTSKADFSLHDNFKSPNKHMSQYICQGLSSKILPCNSTTTASKYVVYAW